MQVSELFAEVSLSPQGPVRWQELFDESRPGVYVIAQTREPSINLAFKPLPSGIKIDLAYEEQRWLKSEPIVYIGKADQPISKRVSQFYKHKFGERSPHAGGQILLLLNCDLLVYWAPSAPATPRETEKRMLSIFKQRTKQFPFANFDERRRPRRVQKI